VRAVRTTTLDELRAALLQPGPTVIEAVTDRGVNVSEHERINSAMADAVRSTLG